MDPASLAEVGVVGVVPLPEVGSRVLVEEGGEGAVVAAAAAALGWDEKVQEPEAGVGREVLLVWWSLV